MLLAAPARKKRPFASAGTETGRKHRGKKRKEGKEGKKGNGREEEQQTGRIQSVFQLLSSFEDILQFCVYPKAPTLVLFIVSRLQQLSSAPATYGVARSVDRFQRECLRFAMCNKGAIFMGIFLFEATCKIQSFVRASFQKRRRMHRAQVEYD